MTYLDDVKPSTTSWLEIAFVGFLRLLALCFIGFSVFYWLRVSGYYEGADWRFDTMSTPWKIASATLSALLPVAAVGLWSAQPWGQVVWTMTVFIELWMYSWFPQYFGSNALVVTFHLATIGLYLILWAIIHYNAKKA
jgi:hypothetical protein